MRTKLEILLIAAVLTFGATGCSDKTSTVVVNAGAEDFRFPREESTTIDGYPTPLSGKPITKTPVIIKKKGASLKKYPEHYIPGKEPLADNEMRVTVLGSGSPTPVRRAQATSGYLVELGNGDNFIFDIGPGTPANLYSHGRTSCSA